MLFRFQYQHECLIHLIFLTLSQICDLSYIYIYIYINDIQFYLHHNQVTLTTWINGNLLFDVFFPLVNRCHPYRGVAVVSWLNYLILAIDLWNSSVLHLVKWPPLDLSLVHIYYTASHGFHWSTLVCMYIWILFGSWKTWLDPAWHQTLRKGHGL